MRSTPAAGHGGTKDRRRWRLERATPSCSFCSLRRFFVNVLIHPSHCVLPHVEALCRSFAITAGRMGAAQVPLAVSKPLTKLPSIFAVQAANHPPLCGNSEGWGPISDIRYDFTPCFLDVWLIFVAAWGIFLGLGAVWYLLRKRIPQDVPKNWHFYAKLYVKPLIIGAKLTSIAL